MRHSEEFQDLLSIFSKQKHQLPEQKVKQFLSHWHDFAQDQAKKVEQNYIRQLVQGQLKENGVTYIPLIYRNNQIHKISAWKTKWVDHLKDKNIFLRVSKNEAIIRVQQCVYFINPSRDTSEFLVGLDIDQYQLYIVMTNGNLNLILNLFSILKQSTFQRIITSEQIYRKMVALDSFLIRNKILIYQNLLQSNRAGLLKPEEYFQYGRLFWKISSCCWYQPVYDLQISNKKMQFLIEGPKLYDSKAIYNGWKKNLISEKNYQKYTAQTEQKQKVQEYVVLFQVQEESMARKIGNKYLNFIKKEVIRQQEDDVQQSLWQCTEQLQYTKGQVIVKRGAQCDFVYSLEKGDFEAVLDDAIAKPADRKILYGFQDLKRKNKRYTFDLISRSDSTVQRIRVENIQFHLYQYLSQFQ